MHALRVGALCAIKYAYLLLNIWSNPIFLSPYETLPMPSATLRKKPHGSVFLLFLPSLHHVF